MYYTSKDLKYKNPKDSNLMVRAIVLYLYSAENNYRCASLCSSGKVNSLKVEILEVNLTYSCIIYSSEFCLGSLQYKESSQIGCV
jgi:hypothetical protein